MDDDFEEGIHTWINPRIDDDYDGFWLWDANNMDWVKILGARDNVVYLDFRREYERL